MFKFKFQKALDYKLEEEHQAKDIYFRIQEKKNKKLKEKEILINRKAELHQEFKAYKVGNIDINSLKNYNNFILKINNEIEEFNKELNIIEKNLEKAREEFFEIRKERKIFEKLKEKQLEEYKKNMQKKEDKLIDELSNNLYNRRN
ncbi:flagellar FliJ protein [Hypnocyclicus thermotrophus]|uniref:Flagellar FliJ protein n=1 Tax=Hypnocyclicus thermotrophus TaxID=1627895 RepID=A0AA46I569_9FUSO|nr:flagellar export protein FliJ [Hypnocyclicus thermotrophus]TDT69136.1 flagellar FliJ protein [Hypnocyclicus thermotrophus]